MKHLTTPIIALALVATISAPALSAPRKAAARALPFQQLVERYDRMAPAEVLQQLWLRTQDDYLQLSIYPALGGDIYLRACYADPNITFVLGGVVTGCHQVAQERANALQFITPQALHQNLQSERQTVLIAHGCSTGRIDRASCAAYTGTMQRYNDGMHETSQQIIRNMGDQCRVGIDPGCVY